MATKKNDYASIEKEFLRDPRATLCSLAKKYNCGQSPLYRYAKAHKWEEKRAKKGEARFQREIERENRADIASDEAWEAVKRQMRETISREWEKLLSDDKPLGSTIASLTRATKDAREMGAYGVTLTERKLLKEIENLERQLSESNDAKSITIKFEGAEEYAQ